MNEIISKEELIQALREIREMGWVPNARPGNPGAVGNTLEDLLGISENNLPIPNAAEWELKCQRVATASLTTLFHMEPSPRGLRWVPQLLLPCYGWPHKLAGQRWPAAELSFRQTINARERTDRGFGIIVDRSERKVMVSFDATAVDPRHTAWLELVRERAGLGELNPRPYWGFDDLFHKAGTKLLNCFYVRAEAMRKKGQGYFWYKSIMMFEQFSLDGFINAIENGALLVDFDARTGHNHGTKFRLRQDKLPDLYGKVTTIA